MKERKRRVSFCYAHSCTYYGNGTHVITTVNGTVASNVKIPLSSGVTVSVLEYIGSRANSKNWLKP